MGPPDFGFALMMLKQGKGMWLMLVPACDWHTSVGPNMNSVPNAHRLPWIAMKTVDDGLVPWLASQTDVLAEDWTVVQ